MIELYSPAEARAYLEASSQFYAGLAARRWYGDHVCLAAHPVTEHGTPDHLVDDGADEGAQVTGSWVDQVVASLDGLATEATIRRELNAQLERLDVEPLAELLHEKMLLALMLGGLDSAKEHEALTAMGVVRFREEAPFSRQPLRSALELWEQRSILTPEAFRSLSDQLRQRAFTFAGAASRDLVATAHAELTKQIHKGNINLRDFKRFAAERLETAGWTPRNKSHVETIFRTNVGSALSAGRHAEMTRPAVLAALPYWQIRGVPDARARPTHKKAHNIVLPASHEFWLSAYPPFGYNCRCNVIARTLAWLRRMGVQVGPVPLGLPDPGFSSGTRGLVSVPADLAAADQTPQAPPPPPATPAAPSPRVEVPSIVQPAFPELPASPAPKPIKPKLPKQPKAPKPKPLPKPKHPKVAPPPAPGGSGGSGGAEPAPAGAPLPPVSSELARIRERFAGGAPIDLRSDLETMRLPPVRASGAQSFDGTPVKSAAVVSKSKAAAKAFGHRLPDVKEFTAAGYESVRRGEAPGFRLLPLAERPPRAQAIHHAITAAIEQGHAAEGLEVWRGISNVDASRVQGWISERSFDHAGTASTTRSRSVAISDFLRGRVVDGGRLQVPRPDAGKVHVLYRMKNRTGVPIETVSFFESEREVLVRAGTRYRMTAAHWIEGQEGRVLLIEGEEVAAAL